MFRCMGNTGPFKSYLWVTRAQPVPQVHPQLAASACAAAAGLRPHGHALGAGPRWRSGCDIHRHARPISSLGSAGECDHRMARIGCGRGAEHIRTWACACGSALKCARGSGCYRMRARPAGAQPPGCSGHCCSGRTWLVLCVRSTGLRIAIGMRRPRACAARGEGL